MTCGGSARCEAGPGRPGRKRPAGLKLLTATRPKILAAETLTVLTAGPPTAATAGGTRSW